MKTYWDHTEDERAALTSAEVDELLKYELMQEGIIIPPDPGDKPQKPDVDLTYVTVYDVTKPSKWGRSSRDTVFTLSSREDADKACEMTLVDSDYNLQIGYDHSYAVYISDLTVSERQVLSRESVEKHASVLEKYKQDVSTYDEKAKAYSEMKQKAVKACESIWEDWNIRTIEAAKVAEVKETYRKYVDYCDGDETIALRFLRKAYDDDLCVQAGLLDAVPAN